MTSQSSGAASPNNENGVVNRTGSGFHEEPDVVSSERWSTSRPHTIHDHESCVGTDGPSSHSAASTKQPATSSGRPGSARSRRDAPEAAAAVAAGGSAISVKVERRPRIRALIEGGMASRPTLRTAMATAGVLPLSAAPADAAAGGGRARLGGGAPGGGGRR